MKEHFFQNGDVTSEGVIQAIRKINPFENPLYKNTDDISTSRLFSFLFSDVARYNQTAKEWYFYDGIVWRKDFGGMKVESLAKVFSKAIQIYAVGTDNSEYQKGLFKLNDRYRRTTLIQDSRDINYISSEMLDADLSLFNCQNCVLNLDTLETLDHSPELLLSKVADVEYCANAKSPVFESFLDAVLCGDKAKALYLQELFGYAMTGDNTQEECYMIYGATTRNGKSTLIETVSTIFGDYAMNIQPETLAQQKVKNSKQASGDIARLDGCRLLRMSEPPKRMTFDVALLKTLLGREKITARHLHESEMEFTPIFKLFINTNYLPVVTDDTLFSSGRVKVITFDRHFEPHEQDVKLKSKLLRSESKSAVLNWCLDGLKKYRENNESLDLPDSVVQATEKYRHKSDKVMNFVEECLIQSESTNTTAKELYPVYENWCQENGYGVENKQNFLDELRGKGLLSATGTVGGRTMKNVIKGYGILSDRYIDDMSPYV